MPKSLKATLIEQLNENTVLLVELKKRFSDSELDRWWRQAIRDSKKLLARAESLGVQ